MVSRIERTSTIAARRVESKIQMRPADQPREVLSVSGVPNASTVRNRSMWPGEAVAQPNVMTTANPAMPRLAEPVIVRLDGGYLHSRHPEDERHFEVIAGK
jgi:hypothetical protein